MSLDLEPHSAIVHRCHVSTTESVLELFEGFFVNFEDALFEYAYRSESRIVQQQCFNLMRELRVQREHLTDVFAGVLERRRLDWYQSESPMNDPLHPRAEDLAAVANNNFAPLLGLIANRMAALGAAELDVRWLPLGPTGVAHAFLQALRARGFDEEGDRMLGELFRRFVLDRLGPIYGDLNLYLLRFVSFDSDVNLSGTAG